MDPDKRDNVDKMAIQIFQGLYVMLEYMDRVEKEEGEYFDDKGRIIKCAGIVRDFISDEEVMMKIPDGYSSDPEEVFDFYEEDEG